MADVPARPADPSGGAQADTSPTSSAAQPWLSSEAVDQLRAASQPPPVPPTLLSHLITSSATTQHQPPQPGQANAATATTAPAGSPAHLRSLGQLGDKLAYYRILASTAVGVVLFTLTTLFALPVLLHGGHWTSSTPPSPPAHLATDAQALDRFAAAAADFDARASAQLSNLTRPPATRTATQGAICDPQSIDAAAQALLRARVGSVSAQDLADVVADVRGRLIRCDPGEASADRARLAADLERVETSWAAQLRAAGRDSAPLAFPALRATNARFTAGAATS